MTRYEVGMSETVYYRVTVEAESEERADELAHEAHDDGTDSEYDSSEVTVDSVEEV